MKDELIKFSIPRNLRRNREEQQNKDNTKNSENL